MQRKPEAAVHRGWVKLWRRLQESELWLSEPFTRGQAWVDLMGLANHKDGWIRKRGIKVEVPRGCCAWSELALSERWKWSRGKLRRTILEWEKDEKIVQQKNRVTSRIHIINYDQYQGDDTTNGQQTVQQTDINKNEKNEKNEKKRSKPSRPSVQDPPGFAEFWVVYPRKAGKGKAREAWKKAAKKFNGSCSLLEICLKSLEAQKQSDQWQRDAGQFIPHPATWLNQERWEDELESKETTHGRSGTTQDNSGRSADEQDPYTRAALDRPRRSFR
jgi:hypothetical protein